MPQVALTTCIAKASCTVTSKQRTSYWPSGPQLQWPLGCVLDGNGWHWMNWVLSKSWKKNRMIKDAKTHNLFSNGWHGWHRWHGWHGWHRWHVNVWHGHVRPTTVPMMYICQVKPLYFGTRKFMLSQSNLAISIAYWTRMAILIQIGYIWHHLATSWNFSSCFHQPCWSHVHLKPQLRWKLSTLALRPSVSLKKTPVFSKERSQQK